MRKNVFNNFKKRKIKKKKFPSLISHRLGIFFSAADIKYVVATDQNLAEIPRQLAVNVFFGIGELKFC